MSHERVRRPTDPRTGGERTPRSIAPGKATLTGRLSPPPGPTAAEAAKPPPRARHMIVDDGDGGDAARELDAVEYWSDAGIDGAGIDGAGIDETGTEAASAAPLSDADVALNTGIARLAEGGEFAATVVAAATDTESAFDNGFTPALVKVLQDNPGMSIDDVFRRASAAPVTNDRDVIHPTIVQYGQKVPSAPEGREIKKHAILVANQNYGGHDQLYTPIAEAGAMKSELASRGYDASVHKDQTSGGMDSLWGSMVGAANPGDQLVAFYGGHGTPEGLLGIEHDAPPNPPDIFTNQQVAGMVSAATGKGAHIRMIMDSCHSGTAAQAVREVRENELAATARSAGDQLRVAAMLGLRQAKQRLLDLLERRADILLASYRERERGAGAPPSAGARGARHVVMEELEERIPDAFERAVDRLWSELVPLFNTVRAAVGYEQVPPPIGDYDTLGEPLNYLDDLWNAVSQSMESAAVETDAGAGAANAAGPASP